MLRLDQQFLETVIPAIGKEVIIVNTGHRGMTATLKVGGGGVVVHFRLKVKTSDSIDIYRRYCYVVGYGLAKFQKDRQILDNVHI